MKHFLIGVHTGYDPKVNANFGTAIDNTKMEWIKNEVNGFNRHIQNDYKIYSGLLTFKDEIRYYRGSACLI